MKNYEALLDLPFGIKKGDIVVDDNGYVKTQNGVPIPYKPSNEKNFFKEVFVPNYIFKVNDIVVLKKPLNNPNITQYSKASTTIPAYTQLKVVRLLCLKDKPCVEVMFNSCKYIIKESDLMVCETYYFISSSGQVQSAIKNRDVNVDLFRMKAKNYYHSKDSAVSELYNILNTTIPISI